MAASWITINPGLGIGTAVVAVGRAIFFASFHRCRCLSGIFRSWWAYTGETDHFEITHIPHRGRDHRQHCLHTRQQFRPFSVVFSQPVARLRRSPLPSPLPRRPVLIMSSGSPRHVAISNFWRRAPLARLPMSTSNQPWPCLPSPWPYHMFVTVPASIQLTQPTILFSPYYVDSTRLYQVQASITYSNLFCLLFDHFRQFETSYINLYAYLYYLACFDVISILFYFIIFLFIKKKAMRFYLLH